MSTAAPTITTLSDKESKSRRKEKARQQNVNIPKFHFPLGKPGSVADGDKVSQAIAQEFSNLEGGKAFKQHMAAITKVWNVSRGALGWPVFWSTVLSE